MENLLAMPIKPVEIMIGKIAPFVLVGFVQMVIILMAAHYLFDVPIFGNVRLLIVLSTLFAASTSPSATRSPPSRRISSRRCR